MHNSVQALHRCCLIKRNKNPCFFKNSSIHISQKAKILKSLPNLNTNFESLRFINSHSNDSSHRPIRFCEINKR